MESVIDSYSSRNFGIEIETNTHDGIVVSLGEDDIPFGAEEVAFSLRNALKENVVLDGWGHSVNNESWIVKPDSSCGIEVCSPVLSGWHGINSVVRASQALRDSKFQADKRCSMHIHVDVSDLSYEDLASLFSWYLKCELVFMDSVPANRKQSKYCHMLGMSHYLQTSTDLASMGRSSLISLISNYKYHATNAFRIMRGGDYSGERKKTMEFRIVGNEGCLDPMHIKCWVRFVLHFVDTAISKLAPKKPKAGCPETGIMWLDPKDVYKFLRFNSSLSLGLQQVKEWFSWQLMENCCSGKHFLNHGIFSKEGRSRAIEEYKEMFADLKREHTVGDEAELLYGKKYIV